MTAANQAELQPLIDDLNSQISTATTATNGLGATVLAFTPAQWNAEQWPAGRIEGLGCRRPTPRSGRPAPTCSRSSRTCERSRSRVVNDPQQ